MDDVPGRERSGHHRLGSPERPGAMSTAASGEEGTGHARGELTRLARGGLGGLLARW
ncbi:MAG: hypothetical protein R2734_14580 [Nocardioides sp.]